MNPTEQLLASLRVTETADWNTTIDNLKGGRKAVDVSEWQKQFDVTQHEVMDKSKRPDRVLEKGGIEPVNRVGLAFQKLIVERAAAFLFGRPAKTVANPDGEDQDKLFNALQRLEKATKIDGHNMLLAMLMGCATEVAECWFPDEQAETHTRYGIKTKFKLRVMRFSPWLGDELYPLFDDNQDLVAFSRQYERSESGNKKVIYFETYTTIHTTLWKQVSGGWEFISQKENTIGKIPIVYDRQAKPEWADVQNLIERLETLLSNYADTVDYHASPTVVVEGKIESFASKGDSGKVITVQKDNKVSYLTLDQRPEMVKLEVENKYRLIYSLTQTPDISFDAIKGIGDVSGIALKLLFLDASLKAQKKILLTFNDFMARRNSLLLAFLAKFDTSLAKAAEELEVETKITPFEIDNEQAMIELLATATNGAQLLSRETAVSMTGLTDDPAGENERIKKESAARQVVSATEPTE